MHRLITLLAVAIFSGAALAARAQENKACGLATAAELEGVLGGKVAGLKGNTVANVEICTGTAAKATVLLRLATAGTGGSPDAAAKGIEQLRSMGAQVDVKTFGAITCSTVTPSRNMEAYGFNTTCTVRKGDSLAGIEITSKSQADMVPIEKLHPLAEKMAGRF
jgi:hypothetical protein